MKKIAVFFSALILTIIVSCGAKDDKNVAEPYPTTDTTKKVEHKNDAEHDSLGTQNH
ncbi:MAG: hypothetical protein H0W61_16215 [Bacteroidetes bacterium]|nr:hypothetical protein [Bacteroidota bacterium]